MKNRPIQYANDQHCRVVLYVNQDGKVNRCEYYTASPLAKIVDDTMAYWRRSGYTVTKQIDEVDAVSLTAQGASFYAELYVADTDQVD